MTKTVLLAIFALFTLFPISAQKVVLQLDATPSSTPSVSKAALRYDKDFAYSLTLDDCTNDHYTLAKPFFYGGVVPSMGFTSSGFFFTDGCGNDVVFKPGIAWNSTNSNGFGPIVNDPSYITWAQLQELYNLGWDVFNHSYAHRSGAEVSGSYTYTNQITQNSDAVRNNAGIEMPCFIPPSADTLYQNVALQLGYKAVFDQNFPPADLPNIRFEGIQVDGTVNTTNFKALRKDLNVEVNNNPTTLSKVADKSTGGAHYWYNEFTHRIDGSNPNLTFNTFKDYMLNIVNTYGKNGSDRVWFAPLEEVFEYIVSRQNANFTTNLTVGNKLEISLNLSSVPTWMRRKTLTLIVNSTVNFSNVTLPQGITATWRGTGATKIINLDFTNYTSPIPVELFAFSAQQKGTTALLNWETKSELRFKGFEIERSFDGVDFNLIGFVKANGKASKYTFSDEKLNKTTYFRLKMIDNDGSFDYSKVVSLFVQSKNTVKITPSVSDETVVVETDFDDRTTTQIEIYNQKGQLMIKKTALNTNTISLQNLPQGIYFVRVNHGSDFWVKKIMKF